MYHVSIILVAVWFLSTFTNCNCAELDESMYCGLKNCYDVLELKRSNDDTSKSIKKAYRKLTLKYHPDRLDHTDDSEEVRRRNERFQEIANAAEILSDDEKRAAYDYYLDHPEERLYNKYAFYKMQYAAKTDIRAVIIGLIFVLASIQHILQIEQYNRSKKSDFALQKEINERYQKLLNETKEKDQKRKAKLKRQLETDIVNEFERSGKLFPPTYRSLFLFQIVLFPRWILNVMKQRKLDEIEKLRLEAEATEKENKLALLRLQKQQRKEKIIQDKLKAKEVEAERKARSVAREEIIQKEKEKSKLMIELRRKEARTQLLGLTSPECVEKVDFLFSNPSICSVDQLDTILEKVLELCKKSEGNGPFPADKIVKLEHKRLSLQYEAKMMLKFGSSGTGRAVSRPWTSDEISVLTKAAKKFPGGIRNRWIQVANYVNTQGLTSHSRSPDECAEQALCAKNSPVLRTGLSEKIRSDDSKVTLDDPDWTMVQQQQLEKGLQAFKISDYPNVKERWGLIASLVPHKSAKDCAKRYKEIRLKLKQAKLKEASS
mmetsp:Transcript_8350/g.10873  ORF Transcript_8350/g.10873 Transcript_8350/m.10873 type:complete len:547 (+) Transcript_8350:186-1826(+)